MKKRIVNPHNLSESDIEVQEERIKVLLINSNNQLLLCRINGIYHFVGGHPENGEDISSCAEREIREETGISLRLSNLEPFFVLQEYHLNYFESGKKALSTINYLCVETDEKPNENNRALDEQEAEKEFKVEYISLDSAEEVLKSTRELAREKRKEFLVNEMIEILGEYKSYQEEGHQRVVKGI